jgi:riboflavin kinase/FMN adenylyltransferase
MPAPLRLFRSLDELDDAFGPCALTIGNFDGVHAGHRRILRRVAELGRERGWKPAAMTFDPHPLTVVAPQRAPRLLSAPEERALLMAGQGIEQLLILPFTRELSRFEPRDFVERIVAGRLGARAVIVGDNFRFGYKHAGDTRLLAELGAQCGFLTESVPAVRLRGRVVSSSEIRRLIEQGRVALACRLLERPYALEGEVVSGQGVGSRQTVPTLNLAPPAGVVPALGVYVTRTTDLNAGRHWPSVTNVGSRPTFGGQGTVIETHLLGPVQGAGSPRAIRVEFLRRLRAERKFDSPEALKAQILRDLARTKRHFQLTAETES